MRKLAERANMPGGWRASRTIKAPGEFESPMPWMHPCKLAGDALRSLEYELDEAVSSGETQAIDMARLGEVLDRYGLRLPLSSAPSPPKFPPRSLRRYT